MQEYWEIYMKNLEGYPASVQFNAGISMDIEKNRYIYPTVGFVKILLKEANEKGLLSDSEEPEILFIEDSLEAAMLKFRIGKYVGRIITNGSVTFIFYLQFTYNWQDFLTYALREFDSYEITNGFSDDSAWNYYQNLLYPTAKEWQIIQNHKVCNALKEQGDTLEQRRAIEHKAYFLEKANKTGFLKALEEEGFNVAEDIKNDDGIIGIKFYRMDKPFYYDIDALTLHLIEVSQTYGVAYDGWETSLVKS